jgi:hypothetical protein
MDQHQQLVQGVLEQLQVLMQHQLQEQVVVEVEVQIL